MEILSEILHAKIPSSLSLIRESFVYHIQQNFPQLQIGYVELELCPVKFVHGSYQFCKLSAHIAGRTYITHLNVANQNHFLRNYPLPLSGIQMADKITQDIKHDFINYLKEKLLLLFT